ncbi:exodeoxyribonuclease III [Leekyejoonella antrihumi]|uniref:Exodeoxyribonuclease III n=1 Tax=Leekyejoonella antrihumi TaxID=1660198 RepID=A0A563E113_9MICO|nr:exodeoxyribonuclease III [Leekyejoonella antrihumi]TWP36059.1 exodeoxyribonuclease III [Leekyejoonella antrihumi]
MRLITANVNGIRAAARRGGLEWLAAQNADAIAVQEVRASDEQLAKALAGTELTTWNLAHAPSDVAGRAGVAVLSPHPVTARESGLHDHERGGRWLEAVVEPEGGHSVTVVSAYVHTGEAGTAKQQEKYAFLEAITARLALLKEHESVVLTGDLNICHRDLDLKNWKGNRGKAGFLPQEQAHLSGWFDDGWVDVLRTQAGEVDGPYTWWSWRGKAFDNDAGWRIDYQIATPDLAVGVRQAWVGRAATYAHRWSDHAAVVVDYDLP